MSSATKKANTSRKSSRPDVRKILLDATEQIICEEGYAAATVRRISSEAGMRHQAVAYYFGSQEDLLLAVLHRSMESHRNRLKTVLASERPLRAMWEFTSNRDFAKIGMEFLAMANHNDRVKTELAKNARKIRNLESKAIAKYLDTLNIQPLLTPMVVSILTTALARFLMQETALGIHVGHEEFEALVEQSLSSFEQQVEQTNNQS